VRASIGGQQHPQQGLLQTQRHSRVVDVLGSEAEVNELEVLPQAQRRKFVAQKVLDGLHIVVRDPFVVFHSLGILQREELVEPAQLPEYGRVHRRELGQRQLAEGNEVLHFDQNAVAHQRQLGEVGRQRGGLAAVATIEGRNGGERGKGGEVGGSGHAGRETKLGGVRQR
jgi:hypothetical protein